MAGDKLPVQIRTRKFIRNALLCRRQFVSVFMSIYRKLCLRRRSLMWSTLDAPMLANQSCRRRLQRFVLSIFFDSVNMCRCIKLRRLTPSSCSVFAPPMEEEALLALLWYMILLRTRRNSSPATVWLAYVAYSLSIKLILYQSGLTKAREGSRKQIKEKKNRAKKVFGVGRRVAKHKAKKANKA